MSMDKSFFEVLQASCKELASVNLADKEAAKAAESRVIAAAMLMVGYEFIPEGGKYEKRFIFY